MKTICRVRSGQSLAELAAGLMILVPVFLLVFDLAVCIIADTINENVCRDAARAASAGVPAPFTSFNGTTIPADAFQRAQAVVKHVYQSGGYIEGPTIVTTKTGSQGPNHSGGVVPPNPVTGGQWDGTYVVTTQIIVHLPASIPGATPSQITLNKSKEFTITRTEKPAPQSVL